MATTSGLRDRLKKLLADCGCESRSDALDDVFRREFTEVEPEDAIRELRETGWVSWYVFPDGAAHTMGGHGHGRVGIFAGDVEGFDGSIMDFTQKTGAMRMNLGVSDSGVRPGGTSHLTLDMYCPVTEPQLQSVADVVRLLTNIGMRINVFAEGPKCSVGLPLKYITGKGRVPSGYDRDNEENRWVVHKDVRSLFEIGRFCRLMGAKGCPPEEKGT